MGHRETFSWPEQVLKAATCSAEILAFFNTGSLGLTMGVEGEKGFFFPYSKHPLVFLGIKAANYARQAE